MGNPFIPFPRNENIIIVGDTATEILGKRAAGVGRAAISTDERHAPVKHVVEILSKDAGECSAS